GHPASRCTSFFFLRSSRLVFRGGGRPFGQRVSGERRKPCQIERGLDLADPKQEAGRHSRNAGTPSLMANLEPGSANRTDVPHPYPPCFSSFPRGAEDLFGTCYPLLRLPSWSRSLCHRNLWGQRLRRWSCIARDLPSHWDIGG